MAQNMPKPRRIPGCPQKKTHNADTREMSLTALHQLTRMTTASEGDIVRFVLEKIAVLTGSPYSHMHILPGSLHNEGRIFWSAKHYDLFSRSDLAASDPECVLGEFGLSPQSADEPVKPVLRNNPVRRAKGLLFQNRLPVSRFLCVPTHEDGNNVCFALVYNKPSEYIPEDIRLLETFCNAAWLMLRRIRDEKQLREARENAEKANAVKDRFLANISHELRTPLNGMQTMLQLLEMTPLSPEQREYAGRASLTGKTLLCMISDILDYTRMEFGIFELECAPFNMRDTLVSSVSLFRAEAEAKKIRLELDTQGTFPPLVFGDEARVRQIIFNLIGNALKFTEQGAIRVTCAAAYQSDGTVRVTLAVHDTGIGIPRDLQKKVFQAFVQVDTSTTRKYQGPGLGLGIARHLTEHMNGSIRLESTPGQGTSVICHLPFATTCSVAPPQSAACGKKTAEPSGRPSLTAIVAEDDAVSRLAIRLFLERLGHRVVCTANGREALEALRAYPFDCLITDVLMPEMDGLEVTRHIRNNDLGTVIPSREVISIVAEALPNETIGARLHDVPRDLPIIAVSAHAMKGDREDFFEKGVDYYLPKPMSLKDLDAMLRRVYHSHIGSIAQA